MSRYMSASEQVYRYVCEHFAVDEAFTAKQIADSLSYIRSNNVYAALSYHRSLNILEYDSISKEYRRTGDESLLPEFRSAPVEHTRNRERKTARVESRKERSDFYPEEQYTDAMIDIVELLALEMRELRARVADLEDHPDLTTVAWSDLWDEIKRRKDEGEIPTENTGSWKRVNGSVRGKGNPQA